MKMYATTMARTTTTTTAAAVATPHTVFHNAIRYRYFQLNCILFWRARVPAIPSQTRSRITSLAYCHSSTRPCIMLEALLCHCAVKCCTLLFHCSLDAFQNLIIFTHFLPTNRKCGTNHRTAWYIGQETGENQFERRSNVTFASNLWYICMKYEFFEFFIQIIIIICTSPLSVLLLLLRKCGIRLCFWAGTLPSAVANIRLFGGIFPFCFQFTKLIEIPKIRKISLFAT